MSVYPRGGVFWYDFQWQGRRYRASTRQRAREDAELVESQLKIKLRRNAAGIGVLDPKDSPRIVQWAGVYYEDARLRMTRPDRIDFLLRVVLRFWGAAPKNGAIAGEPYHDRRLLDPIVDPMWVEKFEHWIARRGKSAQSCNQYRSVMSQMYVLAMKPAYRSLTGVQLNPFLGLGRDRTMERTVTLTVDELRAWLSHASYHVRLALGIAALAPKLRLHNVLALRWRDHIEGGYARIVVYDHKTARHTNRPLVVPINEQLREILKDARARNRGEYVITYHGRPVKSIVGGLRLAAERADLTYGRARGVTFHTIRHTMATMLAELGEPESLRKELMGHQRIDTTQRYTHIRPTFQIAALERLSAATPIKDLVTLPHRRALRPAVEGSVPSAPPAAAEPEQNQPAPRSSPAGRREH